jgi:hypothetical protein
MLDDIERRRFRIDPAREGAVKLPLRVADVELDERAGELLDLPGRGRFASPQPNDHVARTNRLARVQFDFAGNPVALVEQAEHRDPLRHRRGTGRIRGHRLGYVDRPGFVGLLLSASRAVTALLAASAAGKHQEKGGNRAGTSLAGRHA